MTKSIPVVLVLIVFGCGVAQTPKEPDAGSGAGDGATSDRAADQSRLDAGIDAASTDAGTRDAGGIQDAGNFEVGRGLARIETPVIGAEGEPSMRPIGGGAGYSRMIDRAKANYIVSTKAGLLDALSKATSGQVIYVEDAASIDLTGTRNLTIPNSVTLASGRGRTAGGVIFTKDLGASPLIDVSAANVRITGLRLQGPDGYRRASAYLCELSSAIGVNATGFELDNCELFNWSYGAVGVWQTGSASIHHNSIHHTRREGLGYGVVANGPTKIQANIFDFYRHAIASSGLATSSYEASYNIVLGSTWAYPFDMHHACDGDGPDSTSCKEDKSGDKIKIFRNSFYIRDSNIWNVLIEGIPRTGAWVFDNWTAQLPSDISIWQAVGGVYRSSNFVNMWAFHNVYGRTQWGFDGVASADPYRSGDFNADGLRDFVKFESGGVMKVALGSGIGMTAIASWGSSPVAGAPRYQVGDFDGDGREDLIALDTNGELRVSQSTGSSFKTSSVWGTGGPGAEPARLRLGDFDGDGRLDVIGLEASGNLRVWISTGSSFKTSSVWGTGGPGAEPARLRTGDFDGNGRTDAISLDASGGFRVWKSTGSSLSAPSTWSTNGMDTSAGHYRVGEHNGDGLSDILSLETDGYVYVWQSLGNAFANPTRWLDTNKKSSPTEPSSCVPGP